MGWPQWTVIALSLIGMGIAMADHGKPRTPNNFWIHAVSVAITHYLLWAGGFYGQ